MKKTEIEKKDVEVQDKEELDEWTDAYDLWRKLITWDEQELRNNVINGAYEDLKEVKFSCNHLELIDLVNCMFAIDKKRIEKYMIDKYGYYNEDTKKIELEIPDKEFNKYHIDNEKNKNKEYLIKMIEINSKIKGQKLAMLMANHVSNLAMFNRNKSVNFILNRGTRINVDGASLANNSGEETQSRSFWQKLFGTSKKPEKQEKE